MTKIKSMYYSLAAFSAIFLNAVFRIILPKQRNQAVSGISIQPIPMVIS